MNLNQDVRSLMSVVPNTEWWGTTLHELGIFIISWNIQTPRCLWYCVKERIELYPQWAVLIGLAAMQQPLLEGRGLLSRFKP